MKTKKITMEQIAQRLGISKSVVSVAISNKYGVSEELRSRILLTAHEMGYDLNKNKRYVIERKAKDKITLVIANKSVLNEPFWSDIILGIETAVNDNKVILQIFIFNIDMQFDLMLSEIHNSTTNGLILIKDYDNKFVSKLSGCNLPMVVIDPKHFTDVHCPQISVSNYESAYYCAKYLINKGHKHLAFWGDITFSHSFMQRFNGFKDAIIYPQEAVFTPIISKAEDDRIACNIQEFIKIYSQKDYPTAILCANDLVAYLAIDQLKKLNKAVPDDVSIIGFDNLEKSKWLNLTTVNVPKFEMGKRSVEKLLQMINKKDNISEKIEIAAELVERATVKTLK